MKLRFTILLSTLVFGALSVKAQPYIINTYAGSGGLGAYSGDGGVATAAELNGPRSVSSDKDGNLYFVDFYNNRVRKVKVGGTIVNFAGTGTFGNSGDNGLATSADLHAYGVVADHKGNVYISDPAHSVIRKVNKFGIITRYAGTGIYGNSGNGGAATAAKLCIPQGLTVDKIGNLYIADAGAHQIRKVDTFGVITLVAGDGTQGYFGDGLAATTASLDSPYAVAVDRSNNIFIADRNNSVIRKIDAIGIISTYAGIGGSFGFSGDGGLATSAQLNRPAGVAVDTNGVVYISDSYNNVIRQVNPTSGIISLFAGNGTAAFGGDLGSPLGANFFYPYGISLDNYGNMFIADGNNQRIRRIYPNPTSVNNINTTSLTVYPNPAKNTIAIEGLEVNSKVSIYNTLGALINYGIASQNKMQFDIANLPSGNYYISVASAKEKRTIQFVKE